MSIIEMLFKCNSYTTLKRNTQLSISARFKSCIFTNSNKQNAESVVGGEIKIIPPKIDNILDKNVDEVQRTEVFKLNTADMVEEVEMVINETHATSSCGNTEFSAVPCSTDSLESNVLESIDDIQDIECKGHSEVTDPEKSIIGTLVNSLILPSQNIAPSVDDIISPTHHDTLFWCMYIAAFGYNDYLQIGRNYGVKELEIKKLVGESIQSSPAQLKQTNYKITKASIQEIMSDCLTCQKETNMLCFIAIICYFKMNVIMVDSTNKCMLEFISLPQITLPTYVLYKDAYGKYKIKTTPIFQDEIASMKKNMVCLENYLKPLKPISTYKIDDLIQIAKTIGIYDETEKKKKPELYEQISNMIMWR
jgi:hypothetical protein